MVTGVDAGAGVGARTGPGAGEGAGARTGQGVGEGAGEIAGAGGKVCAVEGAVQEQVLEQYLKVQEEYEHQLD